MSFKEVEAFNDTTGAVLCYVVSLKPAGYVIVPGDDFVSRLSPFRARHLSIRRRISLVVLLNGDLPGRLAIARDPAALALNADLITAQDKWQQLEELGGQPAGNPQWG